MRIPLLGPVMLGVSGLILNDDDIRRIQHPLTGAVVLFARNFANRAQLSELTKQIRTARNGEIIIAVDQEGGRVQRFNSDGFTRLPAMRELGKLWEKGEAQQAEKAANAVGYVLAAELRAHDLDLSFTPVLDLAYHESSVIGSRALHKDPAVVSQLAACLIKGMALAGMRANCGKHFPGHGWVEGDTHVEMPEDDRIFRDINDADIYPYQQLKNKGLAAVMAAWVKYPLIDREAAGFSRIWLQTVLREQLSFTGAVLSDALDMQGARADERSVVKAAQDALEAGCDMVICNGTAIADQLLSNLTYLPQQDASKRLRSLLAADKPIDWDTLQHQTDYLEAKNLIQALFGDSLSQPGKSSGSNDMDIGETFPS